MIETRRRLYQHKVSGHTTAALLLWLLPAPAFASPAPATGLWLLLLVGTLLVVGLGFVMWRKTACRHHTGHLSPTTASPLSTDDLASMLESISDGLITLDHQWRYTFVNHRAEQMLGHSRKDMLGAVIWDIFPDLSGTETEDKLLRAMTSRELQTLEETYFEPLDTWFDVSIHPWQNGLAAYFRDVSARQIMLEKLREQGDHLLNSRDELATMLESRRALINALPAHIALLDTSGTIIDVNEQWRRFALENGYTQLTMGIGCNYLEVCDKAQGEYAEQASEVAGGLRDVLDGVRQSFSLEYPCHSPQKQRWFRMTANATPLPGDASAAHHVVVMHIDITERKLAEMELSRLVREDQLTGLLTREGFISALNSRTRDHGWPAEAIVVLMDIISMRDINETYGFEIGDQLLRAVGERLHEHAGQQQGMASRASGDEFIVMLDPGAADKHEQLLATLAQVLAQPFRIDKARLNIETRLGYTHLGPEPRPAETLLREGEAALFQHRETPQALWVVYTPELGEMTRQRIELTRELRVALEQKQFEMYFQPKVELANGRLFGGEALLRWNHPERGMQSPGLFIPVAEKSQLIRPLGHWILRETCRQLKQWQDEGLQPPPVAVNISLVQLLPGNFPARLQTILDEYKLAPDMLTLEITESVFERESDWLMQQLQELHAMGIQLSLDDFGTGYSSLLYLKKYPFDEIKIDRGFVADIQKDHYSREIVRAVMGLSQAFNARVVAEGIETPEVRDALIALNCTIGQGYYYSKPLPAADFAAILKNNAPLPSD